MQYTKNSAMGLGKLERKRLAVLLRQSNNTLSVTEATKILGLSAAQSVKILANLAKKGWLSRVCRGLYVPVPLESTADNIPIEYPLAVAEKLFTPCYIGGFTAAEHWSMTDQLFQTIIIMTQLKPKQRQLKIKNTEYQLHTIKPDLFFGLKIVWQNNVKVLISDPTRTIIDLINNSNLGGGLRSSIDILQTYFNSKEKNVPLLLNYLQKFNNGAIYKRLGFLLTKLFPAETQLIDFCRQHLTLGNAKLDPTLNCNKLITTWKLWVPANWKDNTKHD